VLPHPSGHVHCVRSGRSALGVLGCGHRGAHCCCHLVFALVSPSSSLPAVVSLPWLLHFPLLDRSRSLHFKREQTGKHVDYCSRCDSGKVFLLQRCAANGSTVALQWKLHTEALRRFFWYKEMLALLLGAFIFFGVDSCDCLVHCCTFWVRLQHLSVYAPLIGEGFHQHNISCTPFSYAFCSPSPRFCSPC
jgi:hypothetical protein